MSAIGIGIGIGNSGNGNANLPLPTVANFAFGHNFNAMQGTSDGGAKALALYPGLQSKSKASSDVLPDTVGGANAYIINTNKGWFTGTGPFRGWTPRYNFGTTPYPGSVSSNNLDSTSQNLIFQSGTVVNAQDFTAFYIFQQPLSGDGGGSPVFLYEFTGKLGVYIDTTNRIGVWARRYLDTAGTISVGVSTTITTASAHGLSNGDSVSFTGTNSTPALAGPYSITVTGATTFTVPVTVTIANTTTSTGTQYFDVQKLSSLYAHAGINAMTVRATAGVVKIQTFDGGSSSVGIVGALGSEAGLTSTYLLGYKNNGTSAFRGIYQEDYLYSSGSTSDSDSDALINYAKTKYGLQTKTKFVGLIGDSYLQGFYNQPGRTIASGLAEAHPTWFVCNFGWAGVGTAAMDSDQVPKLRTAVTACKPAGGTATAFVLGGTNDVNSLSAAQILTNLETITSDLKAVASGGQSPVSKVVVGCPPSRVDTGLADINITGYETTLTSLRTSIIADGNFDATVDIKGTLSTPVANTGTELHNLILNNTRWWINDGVSTIISAASGDSADGVHMGVIGQNEMTSLINTGVSSVV